MSLELIGNVKFPSEIREVGRPGWHGEIDVTINSLVNRETKASQIKKLLKSGFDWKKFSPPWTFLPRNPKRPNEGPGAARERPGETPGGRGEVAC